ncbi:fatty acyl-AMP ligase [Micromonospora sp. CPCC 205539]|uniref:fatty acyl-AMP ligase n=1 Tax=Micromonospora sp. CPCC 205539 TaxID=3122408 RepID=UPI002FF13AFF
MQAGSTFTEALRRHVRDRADDPAVVFVAEPDDPTQDQVLSYRELDEQARALASHLRARHPAGARVLLLYPPGIGFVAAFVACQYAGIVAVPAPPPTGHDNGRRRLAGIVAHSDAAAVLTGTVDDRDARMWAKVPIVVTDGPGIDTGADWTPAVADPASVAFLQYTSGSTASPRGTVVSHANVAAHARSFAAMLGIDGPVRAGGWLPVYHDMGLVGHVITPLWSGGTAVLMSPMAFLRRPVSWLRVVDRCGLAFSAAPNFAFELCVNRVTQEQLVDLDLSRWAVAGCGSEPVQARTVEGFIRRFAAAGLRPEAFCPGYGLAEATLTVAMSRPDRRPAITTVQDELMTHDELRPVTGEPTGEGFLPRLVGNGPVTGLELRIVAPGSHAVLPDGTVGEIWLRGPSVAQGYWRDPEATARSFGATTATGEGGFLRTGDLGVQHAGELYVVGRIKDVLIIHGRNLQPQDLEAEARLVHPALADLAGAAFTVPVAHDEVVLVHECRPAAPAGLAESIQRRLARSFGITTSVVLVRPGSVPRTTSGKVRRSAVRSRFLTADLAPTAARLTARTARSHDNGGRS